MANLFVIILYLAVIAGFVVLQIFLSKRESKWLGLILPIISLLFSILMCLSVAGYSAILTEGVETVLENGEVVQQTEILSEESGDIASIILPTILVFLLSNIPTIILTAIYFGCREKIKRDRALEKMNIQDLE